MALSLAAPAMAQTEAELQAQIDSLMSTINALQSQLGQAPAAGGSSASVCPYAWTRSLSNGATGADVMALQQFLNANVATQVAASGPGSAGMETQYYGGLTAAAVSNFQVTYRDEILTPVGLVNPTGYFGPSTMAKANALCSSAPADDTDDDDDTTDDDDDDSDVELSGEASLDSFEIDDVSDDEVEEGEEDKSIGTFTVEFTDGDASISRLDIALLEDGETDTSNTQPWRAFETVSLWVDGDMVAEIDADDEDDYLDEDDGSLRFTGLDIVGMEDEELEITVAVTALGGIDADEVTTWELYALAMRYFDADDVATTETTVGDLQDDFSGATAPFEVVEEGANDDATIESSQDNPDASTLKVEDDSDESEEFDIFVFEIELDEDSGDLELDDMIIDLLVTNPDGNSTTTVDDVIEEITLTINGQTEDGDAVSGTADTELDYPISGDTDNDNRVPYTFEFDGLELSGDDTYEAVLTVVFKGQNTDDYENNVTVKAYVDGSEAQLEGSEGSNVLSGTEESETHTLATVVPVVTDVESSISQANQVSDSGSIVFEFTIEAEDDDVVLTRASLDAAATLISSASTTLAKPTPTLARVSGDSSTESPAGTFTIEEGDEVTFRLTYTFTTASAANNGNYSINLDTIAGIDVDETSPNLTLAD